MTTPAGGDVVGEAEVQVDADTSRASRALQRLSDDAQRDLQDIGAAGRDAGNALENGLRTGGQQGGEGATNAAVDGLSDLRGRATEIAAAVGVAIGAALIGGMTEALDQSRIVGRLRAQLGGTPAEAARFGKLAGELYTEAITEDFQGAADAIRATMQSGLLPPDATNEQIKSVSTRVADLAGAFDEELGGVTRAVSQLMRTGLADSADEAFDIITAGMTSGANKSEDLLDTFNEYSTQFRRLGVDGQTATGLLSQALEAGARDADQVADALGQFGERALAGGTGVEDAYRSIGLSADEMATLIGQGGESAEEALSRTLTALRNTEDEQVKLNAAAALFGDPANVMGDALFALDPATAAASAGMDKATGATDKLGEALRDNAGTRVEQFQREIKHGLVDFLGGTVIPGLESFQAKLGSLWDDAGAGGAQGVDRVLGFFDLLGERIATKIGELVPKATEALFQFGQRVAAWIEANPEQVFKITAIAAALVAGIAALPLLVLAALVAAATVIIAGFVQRMITSTQERLPQWWASFTSWVGQKASEAAGVFTRVGTAIGRWFSGLWSTYIAGPVGRQWDSFVATVRALPGRATTALSTLAAALRDRVSAAGRSMLQAVRDGITAVVDAVRGMPGRASRALGNLGRALYSAGRALIRGFIDGIKSMGAAVANAASDIVAGARDFFPFSPAKEGPLSGRGWVLYSGQAIGESLAAGMEQRAALVRRAALEVAEAARVGAVPLMSARAAGLPVSSRAAGPAGPGGGVEGVGLVRAGAAPAAAPVTNHFHFENRGVIGSRREVQDWLTGALDDLRLQGRLPMGATP